MGGGRTLFGLVVEVGIAVGTGVETLRESGMVVWSVGSADIGWWVGIAGKTDSRRPSLVVVTFVAKLASSGSALYQHSQR